MVIFKQKNIFAISCFNHLRLVLLFCKNVAKCRILYSPKFVYSATFSPDAKNIECFLFYLFIFVWLNLFTIV